MTTSYDITENFPYDISVPAPDNTFTLSDIAYDIVIDSLPFIAKVSNQDQYVRQTAPYRKEQFDNSAEPGEQSLTGWWLRSQTSWHNGAGIGFYEPGTDKEHTTHRFEDSRGVDVWTEGEVKPLKQMFHAYDGAENLHGAVAKSDDVGGKDALIIGDADGHLKKILLNGDSDATETQYTLESGHNSGAVHPIYSVTTDGEYYYALCSHALHKGSINGTTGDINIYGNQAVNEGGFVKYAKGYVFYGNGRYLYRIDTSIASSTNHNSGGRTLPDGVNLKVHSSSGWKWNDLTSGTTHLYASGYNGRTSEIWSIAFDGSGTDSGQNATSLPNLPGARMSAMMPYGEIINSIEYYLGFLVIGTSKGIRVAQTGVDGDIVYGPLLYESEYPVSGLVANDRFVYAATAVKGTGLVESDSNACIVRVDLSQDFGDGTFAYANDVEYESSLDGDSSYARDVFLVDGRIVMLTQEDFDGNIGELQVEHTTNYRTNGWLKTGYVRFGIIEPKFFRFINIKCETGAGDSIGINIIDENGTETELTEVTTGLSNIENLIASPSKSQERMAFKFTFNNVNTDSSLPVLRAWQLKAIPAVRRQRLIQIPLSCFDFEIDRYNSSFGYDGRALQSLQRLEQLEETGKFVNVTDYRMEESFIGVIEQVAFSNETSPDKNSSGFGGLITVTIRKV